MGPHSLDGLDNEDQELILYLLRAVSDPESVHDGMFSIRRLRDGQYEYHLSKPNGGVSRYPNPAPQSRNVVDALVARGFLASAGKPFTDNTYRFKPGAIEWYRDRPTHTSSSSERPVSKQRPEGSPQSIEANPGESREKRRTVFVVHGRNEKARAAVFDFLRALGLKPLEWNELVTLTGQGSPYIGEVLDRAFAEAHAVVVLLTPDEATHLLPEYASSAADPETTPQFQARPNVLFEAGMAFGRNPQRTIMVELGRVRHFSDVAGRHTVRLDGTFQKRHELAIRLGSIGCDVSLNGSDWQNAGDLTPPDLEATGAQS